MQEIFSSKERSTRLNRGDKRLMWALTLIYMVFTLLNLGTLSFPTSVWTAQSGAAVRIDLGAEYDVAEIWTNGNIAEGSAVFTGDDGSTAEYTQKYATMFTWRTQTAAMHTRYITLQCTAGKVSLNEIAFFDAAGNRLPAVIAAGTTEGAALLDEPDTVPDEPSYLNGMYFDEIYHVRTAIEHQKDIWPYEVSHPPLGKLIIGIGISLFGVTPFGWRFMGTLFGVLMLPVMYVFLKKLFGGKVVPVLGTIIFAADFMHYVQTRIATIDTYAVFFILLMYLFMYLWCEDGKKRYLALSGLFFGIGAASKWTCIYAGAGLAVIWALHWIVRAYHRKDDERGGDLFGKFLRNCGFCVVFFVLVPAVIYYVSYYHYGAAKGLTGIGAFFTKEYAQIVLDNQSFMFTYHSGVTASHPYSSRWYQWVLDIRPILYYLDYGTDGTRQSFGAFVNPILCWAGLIALFVLGYEAVAKRDRRAAFILIGYLAQLLPWVFITRITFEYHYFACTVFLVLALGYVIALMRQWNPRWRVYAVGMAVLCVAMFIMFYPALSGMRVDNAAASRLLRWLPTWPF